MGATVTVNPYYMGRKMPRQYKKGLRSTVYERNSIETCREKIRTTQLLKRLQDNGLAEKEFLDAGQYSLSRSPWTSLCQIW